MTPRKAYDDQKRHAEHRGISWQFTYETWLEMWLVSNKWTQRGKKSGQYCMCRFQDEGPYSPKNCYIDTTDNNQQARWDKVRKILSDDHQKIAKMYFDTDLTQREIADHFGVDQSYVSKIIKKVKNV